MEGVSTAFKKVMESEEKNKRCYKHRPPDGGWGWIIVISFAIQNMILLPTLINFGLMFRNVFSQLKMTTTDSSIIINVNSAAGLLFGLLNGPLLKTFGFRKIACIGALMTFFGNSMTSFANSSVEFIVYYGFISSVGVALVMASFSLALNTYFVERRSMATGLAMSVTGLGTIFVPLLISKLMSVYGGRGTCLIMAGLTLHSFAGALLLHPVHWHYRKVDDESEMNEDAAKRRPIVKNNADIAHRSEKSGNVEMADSLNAIQSEAVDEPLKKLSEDIDPATSDRTEHDCGKKYKTYDVNKSDQPEAEAFINQQDKRYCQVPNDVKEEKGNKRWTDRLVELFDLDLLQKPVFINIWVGMAIAFTAEMNFTMMTPFILGDMGYSTPETAYIMSAMGISDICTRLLCPFISSRTKLPARFLYLLALAILVAFRFWLTAATTHTTSLCVFIGLGVGRGLLSVNRSLVVPNHVPLDKLPSASGLSTVLNGVLLLLFGPVLGYLRDELGSYDWYIYVLNMLSIVTIVMWSVEFVIKVFRQQRRQQS